ncbi:MAG: 50S ribosomal protein L6 [Candidatus Yanofskybacteria bacterium GW2011_GWF1_44_227]|uniref:Large ribosomal subunit protein uL6 n=1 Tax=Candidatus Yanofskybacteria bacterium GW2011_GWE2_40_11 TaxID=1619033 RepID=A0A0G0TQD7_9BACT|nr:MAG: 50S ribosomal protein L6 [Candidatus Yanofskybacteria bacterium GW2011_GWE1_40_10]KKR40072.1 MAG: 50S ribosomal protein L6 [Candidatus Yanofskybacteria bacterium GW2011_GWE2_40_11]KKT15059.1 MAG: 50S ribosomal protein L6 [Candidatus Yanofskybacteria bacterium GW2011_GWF2_43_596]KKT52864.1 MAG: 50S ribosomal protein L6 [Candidatus Yanofskybacteria bacterium GW2011_GWF1_44_227]OGN35656.1 MAG: 50S ribosomal protein L6 [Candidatus Yanofskybacteria bacterium RIFOXYA1_FULL_44_17]OGN36693.1 M
MSKIGKRTINIPAGVDIRINDGFMYVKGPKGELSRPVSGYLNFDIDKNELKIYPQKLSKKLQGKVMALWGLSWALTQNMIKGVTDGFEKGLEFQGVGYKAAVKGDNLELELGYSHSITIVAPKGIAFKVEKNSIKVSGIDNELIGKVAAEIRSKRKPEPFQGSGIRYSDEVIKKKAGKKAASTA